MDEDRVMKDFLRWCAEKNGPYGTLAYWVWEYIERNKQ